MIDINLIRMFSAGPLVSLHGSPTVSPTTAACVARHTQNKRSMSTLAATSTSRSSLCHRTCAMATCWYGMPYCHQSL